jgi:N-methylhydantoinase B
MTTDTCGPGKWRGQCGSLWIKEATAPQSLYTFVMSMKYPAAGVNGGGKATPDHLVIEHADGSSQEITHTALYLPLGEGSKIVYQRGGGGGWGDPLERDPVKVRDDVLDEYVSAEAAERDYGVVFTGNVDDYTLEVEVPKTNALRKKMRGGRSG